MVALDLAPPSVGSLGLGAEPQAPAETGLNEGAPIDGRPEPVAQPRSVRPLAQIEAHRRREALRWTAARDVARLMKAFHQTRRDYVEIEELWHEVVSALRVKRPLAEQREDDLRMLAEHRAIRQRGYPRLLADEAAAYEEWRAEQTPEGTPDDYVIPDERATFERWDEAYFREQRAYALALYDTAEKAQAILGPHEPAARKTILSLVHTAIADWSEWINLERDPAVVDAGYEKAIEIARWLKGRPRREHALLVQVMLEALVKGQGAGEEDHEW
jgi:hypothetical protein